MSASVATPFFFSVTARFKAILVEAKAPNGEHVIGHIEKIGDSAKLQKKENLAGDWRHRRGTSFKVALPYLVGVAFGK